MIKFLRLPTDGSEMDSPDPPMRRGGPHRVIAAGCTIVAWGYERETWGWQGGEEGMVRAPSSGVEWCLREEGTDCRGEGSWLCGSVQAVLLNAVVCWLLENGCTVWLEGEGQ